MAGLIKSPAPISAGRDAFQFCCGGGRRHGGRWSLSVENQSLPGRRKRRARIRYQVRLSFGGSQWQHLGGISRVGWQYGILTFVTRRLTVTSPGIGAG